MQPAQASLITLEFPEPICGAQLAPHRSFASYLPLGYAQITQPTLGRALPLRPAAPIRQDMAIHETAGQRINGLRCQ